MYISKRIVVSTMSALAVAGLAVSGTAQAAIPSAATADVPAHHAKGTFSLGPMSHKSAKAASAAAPADSAWTPLTKLPNPLFDEIADTDAGKTYVGLGTGPGDVLSDLHRYDAATKTWAKLANAADARNAPVHGFVGGKLYVAGGWLNDGSMDPKLEIYDPASNKWSTGAAEPTPNAGAGSAVLDGKLYSVGGCASGDGGCPGSTDVTAYDPAKNSWAKLGAFPESVAWTSCGGIAGVLYCAGGVNDKAASQHTYAYNPKTNAWSKLADLPGTVWGASYASAGGKLLLTNGVVNGTTDGQSTNEGHAYDPKANTWSALPNTSTEPAFRGAGAVGFSQFGGSINGSDNPTDAAATLPGYEQLAR